MNGADLLVAALENEGVKQTFGVPSEENLDIIEALRRSKKLPEDIAAEEALDVAPVPRHPIALPVAQAVALDRAAE